MLPRIFYLLGLIVGSEAICDIPPSAWCDNVETITKCGVSDQCAQWFKSTSTIKQISKPVELAVYFESLCPDSTRFFRTQLAPTWQKLAETGILKLTLVPYGNAKESKESSGQWNFQCQHGSDECHGNIIQTCAIHYLVDTAKYMPFISCMMANIEHGDAPDKAAQSCTNLITIPYDKIAACANGPLGNSLEHGMAQQTDALTPAHTYVPWVTLYGVHTEPMEKRAESDLLNLICDSYQGEKPTACSKAAKNQDKNL